MYWAPIRNTTACPTVRMSSLNACANADTTGSAVEEIKVSLPTADPTGKTLLLFLYDLSFTVSLLAVALMEVVNSSEK